MVPMCLWHPPWPCRTRPLRSLPPTTQAAHLRATLLSGLEALAVGVPEDLCAYMAASAQAAAAPISPTLQGQSQPPGKEGRPVWLICDKGTPTALH